MLGARSAAIRQAILRGFLGFPAVIWFLSFTKETAISSTAGYAGAILPSKRSSRHLSGSMGLFRLNCAVSLALPVFFFQRDEETTGQVERSDTHATSDACIGGAGVDCERHYQRDAREIALSHLLGRAHVLSVLDPDWSSRSRGGIHWGEKIGFS